MIVRHLQTVDELLSVLAQPTTEMCLLRALLSYQGHLPSRRTWERQMFAIPDSLAAHTGFLDRLVVSLIQPLATFGCAVTVDISVLHSCGGV